jgi:hypothetical protein
MHPRLIGLLTLVSLTTATGCMEAQRPYQFSVGSTAESPTSAVARTLAANGQEPVNVDEKLGLVQTRWQDTAFFYGSVGNVQATIVRRYTVTVAPGPTGNAVSLRADLKKCPQGGFTIGDTEVRGLCETIDGVPGSFQQDVDALGSKLQQSLAAAH